MKWRKVNILLDLPLDNATTLPTHTPNRCNFSAEFNYSEEEQDIRLKCVEHKHGVGAKRLKCKTICGVAINCNSIEKKGY